MHWEDLGSDGFRVTDSHGDTVMELTDPADMTKVASAILDSDALYITFAEDDDGEPVGEPFLCEDDLTLRRLARDLIDASLERLVPAGVLLS